MGLAEQSHGATRMDRPSGSRSTDDLGSSQKAPIYTRVSISNCVSLDGEVSDQALDILDTLPSAYMEMNPSRTGFDILLVGERPKWCKSNKVKLGGRETVEVDFDTDWMPETKDSFKAPVPEEADHTEALEVLCSTLFPSDKALFYSDREEIFKEPTKEKKVHPYIQRRIRKTQAEYLSVIWNHPADLLIMLAILDRFLEKGCEYEGYDLKGDIPYTDIRLKTGLSVDLIRRRLKALHLSDYPLTLIEKNKMGNSRRYRLSSSHTTPKRYLSRLVAGKLKEANNNKNNSKGFYPYTVMYVNRRILNFTPLSPIQKYVVMLLGVDSFRVSDLYKHSNYSGNKDNFTKQVIKPLRKLGLVEKEKKVISLVDDIEDRLLDLYQEEREKMTHEDVAKKRVEYKEMILYGDVDEGIREEILKNRNWDRR